MENQETLIKFASELSQYVITCLVPPNWSLDKLPEVLTELETVVNLNAIDIYLELPFLVICNNPIIASALTAVLISQWEVEKIYISTAPGDQVVLIHDIHNNSQIIGA
jgi:hypothetical protein